MSDDNHSKKPSKSQEGPLGDKIDNEDQAAPTPGGQPQEPPEKRIRVGTVTPEDYPEDQRAKG